MPPSVLHLSTYDANGGAARAAYALHRAMVDEGLASTLQVASRATDDPTVIGPRSPGSARFRAAQQLDRQTWRLERSPVATWRSPAVFGSLDAGAVNASAADVVNLHWVTAGFLSIVEIGRITKPVVWSLYDMWPFSGTEHYGNDTPDARWRTGYTRANRPADEGGVDLDRRAWERKRRHWSRPMTIVAASSWLHDRASGSALFRHWPQERVPHVIDCEAFRPVPVAEARTALGLPTDRPLILFLASAGVHDRRKGWDLLDAALPAVRARHPRAEVVVVGPPDPGYVAASGTPIRWLGSVEGNEALALLYTAADVTAVPSREDNMPLTAMEAQTCGRAVVAFRIGGLPDIVAHGETGYLAPAGDTARLAEGLTRALDDSQGAGHWGTAARARALATWSPQAVVPQYRRIYEGVLP